MTVQRADITRLDVDAVVNAANRGLRGGAGVDGAIHAAGGPSILAECQAHVAANGPCETGDAVVTGAGDLPARHVIHTVGPVWSQHEPGRADELLGSCYTTSLDRAVEHGDRRVAFPNISTGVYGFPKPRAAQVAVAAVRDWLDAHPDDIDEVVFCCFDGDNEELYRDLLAS